MREAVGVEHQLHPAGPAPAARAALAVGAALERGQLVHALRDTRARHAQRQARGVQRVGKCDVDGVGRLRGLVRLRCALLEGGVGVAGGDLVRVRARARVRARVRVRARARARAWARARVRVRVRVRWRGATTRSGSATCRGGSAGAGAVAGTADGVAAAAAKKAEEAEAARREEEGEAMREVEEVVREEAAAAGVEWRAPLINSSS